MSLWITNNAGGGNVNKAIWYYEVGSGTTGTVTPPSGGTIKLDEFASGVDALCVGMSGAGGFPTWQAVTTAGGLVVAVTLDGAGNFVLTGIPASYPVAVVFVYTISNSDYDSTYDLLEHEIPGAESAATESIRGEFRNLVIQNNVTNPNYQVNVTANELILHDAAEETTKLTSVSVTIDITVLGDNGRDTGSEAASTWYYIYVAKSGITTVGVLSTSSTAPAGYAIFALVGAIYNNASSNFRGTYQKDKYAAQEQVSVLASGTAGSWTAINLAVAVPEIAKRVIFYGNIYKGSANNYCNVYVASQYSPTMIDYDYFSEWMIAGDNVQIVFLKIMIILQTIYYYITVGSGTGNVSIFVNGYFL